MFKKIIIAAAIACAPAAGGQALAATATATFNVTMTIQAGCTVTGGADLNFGTVGVIATNVDTSTTFQVTCTNTTPYTIGLSNGLHVSGAQRRMLSGAATINYNLYSDTGRTTAWSDSATVGSSGTGAAQTFTVYGRVPAQTTPAPATYTDVVTVTVTY